ncbi:indolepyruvate ferredoxin oxidoreductase, beta subunit [Candidatus Desulfosporosinus infrequens]|uniref:Indolepyruvate ferredoxin oxidoreductase, beta subunit n=1 Tax=Candidatus Desulfosporosinus infrequens TaxID=2043169 RepID=A0A2U3L4A3_9FIRM|nr:indolepyruvate ferredoxin oxidoreductase, beta subunit [Candidatus Desulfosporosinus infrequens]
MMNCILAGVGGQGIILASKLIAQSAMNKGLNVRTAETIGMAQRGGCVVSHVRIGEEVHSPLIPLKSADVIIGFEPAEAVRCLGYLKENGTVIVSQKAIKPVTVSLAGDDYDGSEMLFFLRKNVSNLIIVDSDSICAVCDSPKVLNIALLGAVVASGVLAISLAEMEVTIKQNLPEKFVAVNLQALRVGAQAVLKENK